MAFLRAKSVFFIICFCLMRTEFFPWIRYCTRIFCKLYILYKVPRHIQNSKSSATSKFSSYRSAPSIVARIITALCAIGFFIKNEFWISVFVSGNCGIFLTFPSWSINWKLEPHKIYSGFFQENQVAEKIALGAQHHHYQGVR